MSTFQEQVAALPENERTAFFRGIFAVCEAGRKADVSPKEWARQYATVYQTVVEADPKEKNT